MYCSISQVSTLRTQQLQLRKDGEELATRANNRVNHIFNRMQKQVINLVFATSCKFVKRYMHVYQKPVTLQILSVSHLFIPSSA